MPHTARAARHARRHGDAVTRPDANPAPKTQIALTRRSATGHCAAPSLAARNRSRRPAAVGVPSGGKLGRISFRIRRREGPSRGSWLSSCEPWCRCSCRGHDRDCWAPGGWHRAKSCCWRGEAWLSCLRMALELWPRSLVPVGDRVDVLAKGVVGHRRLFGRLVEGQPVVAGGEVGIVLLRRADLPAPTPVALVAVARSSLVVGVLRAVVVEDLLEGRRHPSLFAVTISSTHSTR